MEPEPEIFNMLTALQRWVAERLEQLDLYTGREGYNIVTEDLGDVLAELEQRLAAIGLGIAVVTPKISKGERPREIFVAITIAITEMPTLNRGASGTRISAMDVALAVCGLFDNQAPDPWAPFLLQEAQPVAVPDRPGFKGAIEWDVTFQTGTILHVQSTAEAVA